MKNNKIAALIALVAATSTVHASGSNSISGIIRFTGEIVVAACDMPAAQWYQHAGREHGQSPVRAGAVPPHNGICAGIADTQSVNFRPVAYGESGTVRSGIVTVVFN